MVQLILVKLDFLITIGPSIDLVGYLRLAEYSLPKNDYLAYHNFLRNSNKWDISYAKHNLLPWETIHTLDTTIDPIKRQKLLAYKGPGSLHCKNQILRDYCLRNDMALNDTAPNSTPTHIWYSDLLKPLFWTKSLLLRTMIANFLLKGDSEIVIEAWRPFTRPNGKEDVLVCFMYRDLLRKKYRDAGCWYDFNYWQWNGGYNWTHSYFTYVQLMPSKSPFGNQLNPPRWTHHWVSYKYKFK
jgi:hypothetical protein